MQRFPLVSILGCLLTTGLIADPFYQLSFTGVITSGRASGYNPSISNNSATPFADLTGSRVTGFLIFDLGLAPAADVTIDSGGHISTQIQTTGTPVFVSEYFSIDGFTIPSGFVPLPTVFDLQPAILTFPGSTTNLINATQFLGSETDSVSSPQNVHGTMHFQDFWNGPRFNGGHTTKLDILASSASPFFSIPPSGSFPVFGPANVGVGGVFDFANLSGDATIPVNFGITQFYDVNGVFSIDSASGTFFTPEPATFVLSLGAFAFFAAVARVKLPRRQN